MKGLWHGVYFPREERLKFADRWRNNMDVNAHGIPETKKPLIDEFLSAGIIVKLLHKHKNKNSTLNLKTLKYLKTSVCF